MHDDLRNLIAATDSAALFLDGAHRIRLSTPHALAILAAGAAADGQPLFDITRELATNAVITEAIRAMERGERTPIEITTRDGRRYALHLHPYFIADGRADGVVLTFTEVEAGIQPHERRRLVRDLHDQLGQEITAVRLALESSLARVEAGGELEKMLSWLLQRTARLDEVLDSVMFGLQSPTLETQGLGRSLAMLVQEWSKKCGVPAEFQCTELEEVHLDSVVESNVTLIAQEALNNVLKHAHATRVDVTLERRDDHAVLIVEDDGEGFNQAGDRVRSSFGLLSMRERAALVGGRLEVESIPGTGTVVLLQLPLPHASAGA